MANQTVQQLIRQSLIDIGVQDRTETLDPTDLADGIFVLNSLLNRWSSERYGIYEIILEDFTLTADDEEYTIGPTGDLVTVRPTKILTSWVTSNNIDFRVEIISREEYARRADKRNPKGVPYQLYYEPNYPDGTIKIFLVPATNYTLHLESWKPLAQFTSGSDEVAMPPEYQDAIRWNLAVDLAPGYSVEPSQIVVARADEGLRIMKKLHAQPVPSAQTDMLGKENNGDYEISGDVWL
jgi:hypothetical protein